eukprot:1987_1
MEQKRNKINNKLVLDKSKFIQPFAINEGEIMYLLHHIIPILNQSYYYDKSNISKCVYNTLNIKYALTFIINSIDQINYNKWKQYDSKWKQLVHSIIIQSNRYILSAKI